MALWGLSFPALESIGQVAMPAGPSQSGDVRTDVQGSGGIGPVIVGGFKSDGSATAIPSSWLLIGGAVLVGLAAWAVLRRWR